MSNITYRINKTERGYTVYRVEEINLGSFDNFHAANDGLIELAHQDEMDRAYKLVKEKTRDMLRELL